MPLGLHTQQSRPDARPRHARTSACPALTLDASLAAGHGLSRPKAIRPAALAAAGGRAAARRRRRTGAAHVAGGRRRARSGQAPELHAADLKLLAARQARAAERLARAAAAEREVAVQAERVRRRAAQRHAVRAPKLEEVIAHDAHALLVPAPERRARLRKQVFRSACVIAQTQRPSDSEPQPGRSLSR